LHAWDMACLIELYNVLNVRDNDVLKNDYAHRRNSDRTCSCNFPYNRRQNL